MQCDLKNPQQALLEVNESDKTVEVRYADNLKPFELPLIGPRPPYYTNQRCDSEYPIL